MLRVPTPEEIDGIARVVRAVRLRHIELIELKCRRAPSEAADGIPVRLEMKVFGHHRLSPRSLTTRLMFSARTIPATLEADATFSLDYELAANISESDAESFTKHNAVFNAWPYWRELLQSVALRMGLAPLTIPLLHR